MAVTGQFTIAREATFSWTAGSGDSQTVSVVGLEDVAWSEGRHYDLTVPVGYKMERYTIGILWCRVLIGSMYDKSGATPTSPGLGGDPPTNPGTIVATFASGDTKTCTGFIVKLDWASQGGSTGGKQKYNYLFIGSAESATGTITTA